MTYELPHTAPVADTYDAAGNLAAFLTVNAGCVLISAES